MCWLCSGDKAIPVGVCGDNQTLGIACAKGEYGADFVDEVLFGYMHHGKNGRLIRRITLSDVRETDICEKCENPLWICNSCEVRV